MDKDVARFYITVAQMAEGTDLDTYLRSFINTDEAWLRQLYTAANRSVKDIAKDAGLTQTGLAEYFGIPRRTAEDWCRGISKCPLYTRLMMQEILGLVQRQP